MTLNHNFEYELMFINKAFKYWFDQYRWPLEISLIWWLQL